MRTLYSPPAAREFRPESVPCPGGEESRLAGLLLEKAVAAGMPVDLEIGCGVGWHPIRYAQENPGRTLVAIERTVEKFSKFRDRISRNQALPNLIPVHADAIAWITHFAPEGVFSRIFLLYPNPNLQNPQSRWIRMPFFGHLLEKLTASGSLELRTNIPDYAAEIRNFYATWGVAILEDVEFDATSVPVKDARTHFEKKYLARGDRCFSIRLGAIPEKLR